MIVQMLKNAWAQFTAPFRPRQPTKDWTPDLLRPEEKHEIVRENRRISQNVERLQRELSLINKDHRRD